MVQLDAPRRVSEDRPADPSAGGRPGADGGPPARVAVGCRLDYWAREEATFLFNVMAVRRHGQAIADESLEIRPDIPVTRWTDRDSGNRFVRLVAPPGPVSVTYRALVARSTDGPAAAPGPGADDVRRFPTWAYRWLSPSRYCESDRLADFAQRTFDVGPVGTDLVRSICDWLTANLDYEAEISDTQTGAVDTLRQRAGVCRDFAHLAIALCRALSIPARFVTGYAWDLEPQDFHALVEAYCGGRWRLFDPTGRTDPRGLVRIGTGLDAAQVPFSAFFGDCALTGIEVSCVRRAEDARHAF